VPSAVFRRSLGVMGRCPTRKPEPAKLAMMGRNGHLTGVLFDSPLIDGGGGRGGSTVRQRPKFLATGAAGAGGRSGRQLAGGPNGFCGDRKGAATVSGLVRPKGPPSSVNDPGGPWQLWAGKFVLGAVVKKPGRRLGWRTARMIPKFSEDARPPRSQVSKARGVFLDGCEGGGATGGDGGGGDALHNPEGRGKPLPGRLGVESDFEAVQQCRFGARAGGCHKDRWLSDRCLRIECHFHLM